VSDEVVVVEPDPRWPAVFEAEAARLRAACGARVTSIEHVGSTSVPGLPAKPVVDIQAVVPTLADADALVPTIVALGYEYHAHWESEIPRRRYFVKRGDGARLHHLHVVESGYWLGVEQLEFRDHLRRRPDVAARYAALKRDLAARFPDDRDAYTQAKSEFIGDELAAVRDAAPPGAYRGHAVVVGGTGMLRAATLGLAAEGRRVSVVARNARRLAALADDAARAGGRVRPVCVDWRDSEALAFGLREATLELGPPALAVVWAHSDAPDAPLVAAEACGFGGRRVDFVHVLGSASADPSRTDDARAARFAALPKIARREAVLGFVVERGRSRWLTDAEISAGVLAAVRSRAPRTVVGVVEPWDARP
jgi:GrpB-like predicted nucleotidyltransferase (UPF0157 family)